VQIVRQLKIRGPISLQQGEFEQDDDVKRSQHIFRIAQFVQYSNKMNIERNENMFTIFDRTLRVTNDSWSTGRELNPRILVLQTSALATSPPVLILLLKLRPETNPDQMKNPPGS
jgi:hypothetical protein